MADGLSIKTRDRIGIASVMARKGAGAAAVGTRLGIDLPTKPGAVFSSNRSIIGTGPGTWMVIEEDAGPDFSETLGATLAGVASVSDQSSAYVVQRLSGLPARTLLQRGAAIDFHPSAFATGSAATTIISHIGVILWQVDDQPTYDVAVFRSFTSSFNYWLAQASRAI